MLLQAELDIVEHNFRVLDEIQAEGHEAFRKELRSFLAAQHALQQSAEATLDAATHLIAMNGFRRARDYADLFLVLVEAGVLEAEPGDRLRGMARFRNLIVHRYAEVDPEEVWRIIVGKRKDRLRFFEAVLR